MIISVVSLYDTRYVFGRLICPLDFPHFVQFAGTTVVSRSFGTHRSKSIIYCFLYTSTACSTNPQHSTTSPV